MEVLKARFVAATAQKDQAALKEIMGVFTEFEAQKKMKIARKTQAQLREQPSGVKQWTLEELKQKPEGLNHARLEMYLNEADFKAIFKINKSAWKDVPETKKKRLKNEVGL